MEGRVTVAEDISSACPQRKAACREAEHQRPCPQSCGVASRYPHRGLHTQSMGGGCEHVGACAYTFEHTPVHGVSPPLGSHIAQGTQALAHCVLAGL